MNVEMNRSITEEEILRNKFEIRKMNDAVPGRIISSRLSLLLILIIF